MSHMLLETKVETRI